MPKKSMSGFFPARMELNVPEQIALEEDCKTEHDISLERIKHLLAAKGGIA